MEAIPQNIPHQEIDQIVGRMVEIRLAPAFERFVRKEGLKAKEVSLIERVIRLGDELKALREIERAHFEAIEKRFEALQRGIIARSEAMDKRFEALLREMSARFEATDKRFEAMDKRFSLLQWFIGIGFSVLALLLTLFRFYPS